MLVIKTRNGYAVVPFTGEVPQTSLSDIQIAVSVEDSSWSHRGRTVCDVLKAHFEPADVPALKAA
jgi:hypothetical protein